MDNKEKIVLKMLFAKRSQKIDAKLKIDPENFYFW